MEKRDSLLALEDLKAVFDCVLSVVLNFRRFTWSFLMDTFGPLLLDDLDTGPIGLGK